MKVDNYRYIASVVSAYWFVSISMVYLNKVLMSSENVSINAPLFVTWFQCVVTCAICIGAGKMAEYHKKLPTTAAAAAGEKQSFWAQFPKAQYDRNVGMRVLPLSAVFVGMITFNNLCLKYVEVSFYNVARSLTIVFNVIFSYVMLGISSSNRTLLCLGIVIGGFFVGSAGELNFSAFGSAAGILSSMFVCMNSIYTKKILPVVEDNHWRLTFYNNFNAVVMFMPLIMLFESPVLVESMGTKLLSPLFWTAMFIAGFFGFSMGIVTVLQIKATSPLTHNISGTAKAAAQSGMAFFIWKNQPTIKGILGIAFVLGGSLLYTFVKMSEDKSRVRKDEDSTEMKELLEEPEKISEKKHDDN